MLAIVVGLATVAMALPASGSVGSGTATVIVSDFQFEDVETGQAHSHVAVGGTVTWVFTQGVHTATQGVKAAGVGTPAAWDSGFVEPHDSPNTFSLTFTQPGVVPYYCVVHEGMRGAVIVA